MSKLPRMKAPRMVPTCCAVDPDFGGVVDAVEVEPDVVARVGLGDGDFCAVPVGGAAQGFGDVLGAVVFAVEGLGVDLVVDEGGEDGAGNGGGVPARCVESGGGDLGAVAAPWRRPAAASRRL